MEPCVFTLVLGLLELEGKKIMRTAEFERIKKAVGLTCRKESTEWNSIPLRPGKRMDIGIEALRS
jgi:hypothetical protein